LLYEDQFEFITFKLNLKNTYLVILI
jgi:hypothetical protein